MKYLSHYIEKPQTELFDRLGVFFAFSNKQFDEKAVQDVEYVSMGMGMICPKENAQSVHDGLEEIQKAGIAQDIKENGIEAIIERELANHECYYTGNPEDCIENLKQYGITAEQVMQVFRQPREG